MNSSTPLMGVKLMYVLALPNISKQLCTTMCFSSLNVSEMCISGVSSMYNVVMHCLNSFLSCSIWNSNLNLAFLSRLFTIKINVFFHFTSFNSHSGLFP